MCTSARLVLSEHSNPLASYAIAIQANLIFFVRNSEWIEAQGYAISDLTPYPLEKHWFLLRRFATAGAARIPDAGMRQK